MANLLYQPNFDARWKELIKGLHKDFIQKFFPNLFEQIDFAKGVRFLDKEMQKLFADWAKKGILQRDVLLEYHLKDKQKQLVLVHVEAQHGYDISLPERMFVTFYRIRDKHTGTPLAALALYTGAKIPLSHNRYTYTFEETRLVYEFKSFQIKEQSEADLLKSGSPVDLAILAGFYVLQVKNDAQKALAYKRKLARMCFEKGYDKETVRHLIIFVSFLIALPEQEKMEYENEIINFLDMEPIPLIKEDPFTARVVERLLLGKTLEERDRERDVERDRKRVLKASRLGLSADEIAGLFDLKTADVLQMIAESKKRPKRNSAKRDQPGSTNKNQR